MMLPAPSKRTHQDLSNTPVLNSKWKSQDVGPGRVAPSVHIINHHAMLLPVEGKEMYRIRFQEHQGKLQP